MNTKFPINGRYTTLGDLIHEYAKYSSYPDASKNTTYTGNGAETFNDIYLWNYQKLSMPFVQLIYNGNPANDQKALYPYSVVWFDNVYGDHIDPKTRRMQIIQTQDSSALNFDTPITADSIKNKDAIKDGQFMFRFIIPDEDNRNSDHFYYNYRTANNEAVVMYALRNLLEITKDKKFYFGELNTDSSDTKYRILNNKCTHSLTIKYSYEKVTNKDSQTTTVSNLEQTVQGTVTQQESAHTREWCKNTLASGGVFMFNPTNDPECEFSISTTVFDDTFFLTIDVSEVLPYNTEAPADDTDDYITYTLTEFEFIAWNSFTTDPLPEDNSEELISRVSAGNCLPLFNIEKQEEQECLFLFNNNNIVSLKPDAYQYLGNYFWTLMYVLHNNYVSIVKYHEGVNQNGDSIVDESKAIYKSTETVDTKTAIHYDLHNYIRLHPVACIKKNGNIKSSQDMLIDLAYEMACANNATTDKTNRNNKYLRNSTNNYAKALYFLTLFVNSQRFFVSHVTSFEYVNISNKSYALREPLLRCDLGLFQIIEYITITKAVQIADTVLPPWGLDADTKIDISITYKIKYKDIPLLKDGNSILSFTLKDFWDIKDNDNTPDEKGKIKRWVRLVQPGSYSEVSLGVISKDDVSDNENPAFGTTDPFGTNHFLQPIDKNQPSYSDCSLGTLKWPFNDPDLQVADEHSLKLLAGNTSENSLYASTANANLFGEKSWDDFKNDNYAPFGYLRIFDYLDNKLIDSSFIINVPILRCKNWWYESGESNSIDTANIASYFDKLYLDAQIAEPEPTIGIYTNTYAYGNDPNNIQKILDKLNTLPIAAPTLIGTVDIRQYFGTKIGKATKWVYASGASEIDPNSLTTPEYTSNNPMYFETMNSALGAWAPKNNYIISRTHTSNTVDQYDMGTDYRTPVTGIYTLCRVYIDVDEQGKPKDNTKCFYFKVTNATHTTGNKINVTFLTYKDTNSKLSAGEQTLGFSDHGGITASFILYNYNKPDDITGIGTGSPSNTLTINALLLINHSSRDITIIDDEYNNFILSSLIVPNAFLLIKYHDTEAIYNILHLFHYGLKNNKPVVCFKNPKEMFHYPYPAIIDDNFDPSSISFEPITLDSKFINTDNLLTTDRTLYFSLNNIFAFLDLSDSTVIVPSDLVVDCPETKFSLGGVTYFDTNKLKDSITFSAAAPGIVMSFVSDNVFLTTKNILVQGSSTLSDYLNDLKNRNILVSIVIQLFNFKNNDEINFNTTPTSITVTTSTKNDYNLKYIDPDSLTILKFRIELYKEDTSTDTFTVYLANSGWRGNDSTNVVIFAIKIPAIGSTPPKTIGNVNDINITDAQRLEIESYNNKFPNGTEVYVGVPEVSYEIGSDDSKTWCKHTGWAIDTIPYGTGAPRTIHFSNISESGKYMSQRTVYALFADFTSNTGGGTTPTVPEYGFTINIDEPSHINKTGTNTNSTYPANSPISIEIVAIEGYRIKSATLLPNIATFTDNKFVFNMPALNVTITITTEAVSTPTLDS